jgi:hypothetical protein
VRVRGNTYQVMEKYLALARDASLAGDRIAMENYLQHAEHYYRTINADGNRPRPPMRNDGQPGQDGQQNGQYGNSQVGNEQGGNVQGGNGQASDGQAGNGQAVNGQGGNDQAGNSTNGYESQRAVPADEPGDDTEN